MDESVHVDQDDSVVGAPASGDYNKDLEEHVGILVLAEDTTQAGGPIGCMVKARSRGKALWAKSLAR